MTTITTTTITTTGGPVQASVPHWISGHQCLKIEYNPTSEYKLKRGEKTGYGVICQYTTRAQRDMNAIYVGGLDERTPEGYGEWHSEDEGFSYHGGWKNGLASGYGKFTDSWTTDWPDSWARFLPGDAESTAKHTYIGGFKDGYFHGWGELTFKDKSRYEGSWKDGRRWGYGKYIKDDGTTTVEFQPEGWKAPEPKKEKKDDDKKDNQKPSSPQYIYVQPPQPQYVQPIIQVPGSQPAHEHTANAGINLTWGHGNVQQPSPPQPGLLYTMPPPQPTVVEIPGRPTTPQPIPLQYTIGGDASRPGTPSTGHQNSQAYIISPIPTVPQPLPQNPPAGGAALPYPPDGKPLTTAANPYLSHM